MAEENMMIDSAEVLWADPPQGAWQIRFVWYGEQTDEIASLYIEDGQLCFEGNMDEAAKMFFEEYVKPLADEYIREALTNAQPNHPS